MMLIGAALQLKDGRISYGWEGHEPSGYIAGTPAKLLSLVMALAGLAMLVWPLFLLELLGWEKL